MRGFFTLFFLTLLAVGVLAGPHGYQHARLHRRASTSSTHKTTTTTAKSSTSSHKTTTTSSLKSSTTLKTSTKTSSSLKTSSTSTITSTGTSASAVISASLNASTVINLGLTSSTSANAPRAAPTLSCPSSNSSIYAGSNSENFIVQCYLDHQGGDLSWQYTNTLDLCISACSTTLTCQAVSWIPGSPGQCYLKSAIQPGLTNSGVWGAMITSGTASTTSTTTSSSSTRTSTTSSSSVKSSSTSTVSSSKTSTTKTTSSSTVKSSSTSTASAVTKLAGVTGFVQPQPTGAKGAGVLPVTLAGHTYLGAQVALYADGTVVPAARDLGYSGVIGGYSLWTYGDTLVENTDGSYQFDSYDSAAIGTLSNSTTVTFTERWNYGNDGPADWIPETASEIADTSADWAEGGTNVVETSPGVGFVYYQENNRVDEGTDILGCGVANVAITSNGTYSSSRTENYIFSAAELCWGQFGAAYNAEDGYIYVYTDGPNYSTVVARVTPANAHNPASYSAYNAGTGAWVSGANRFTTSGVTVTGFPSAVVIDDTWGMAGIGWNGMSQSAPFWSAYYNTWMWVHGDGWGYSDVNVMTAPNLYGPWTDAGISIDTSVVCPASDCSAGYRYAFIGHPEYDPTGKTVLASWAWTNQVWLVELQFA